MVLLILYFKQILLIFSMLFSPTVVWSHSIRLCFNLCMKNKTRKLTSHYTRLTAKSCLSNSLYNQPSSSYKRSCTLRPLNPMVLICWNCSHVQKIRSYLHCTCQESTMLIENSGRNYSKSRWNMSVWLFWMYKPRPVRMVTL